MIVVVTVAADVILADELSVAPVPACAPEFEVAAARPFAEEVELLPEPLLELLTELLAELLAELVTELLAEMLAELLAEMLEGTTYSTVPGLEPLPEAKTVE